MGTCDTGSSSVYNSNKLTLTINLDNRVNYSVRNSLNQTSNIQKKFSINTTISNKSLNSVDIQKKPKAPSSGFKDLKDYVFEKLDDEIYEMFKGTFSNIISSQNGSRSLQKVIKSSNYKILLKIIEEVKKFY